MIFKKKKIIIKLMLTLRLFSQDTIYFKNYKDFTDSLYYDIKKKYNFINIFKFKSIQPPNLNVFNWYKGTLNDSNLTGLRFLNLLNVLNVSSFENDSSYQYILTKLPEITSGNNILPIAMCLYKYYDIKDSVVFINNIFSISNKRLIVNSVNTFNPFKVDTLFAASPLSDVIYTNTITFKIDASYFFSNINLSTVFNKLMINFDNGDGYKTYTNLNIDYNETVFYPSNGIKTIKFKFIINNGDTLYSRSQLKIENINNNFPTIMANALPPDDGPFPISFNSISGYYAIWYGCNNTSKKIRKPYIITTGFNPGNGKQLVSNNLPPILNFVLNNITINFPGGGWNGEWRGTYYETYNGVYNKRFSPYEFSQYGETDNGCQLLDRIREEGYDVIILQFDNGTDYIENNALLLEELIRKINQKKFQNGYYFENIVTGYSAGAMASRLALANMESKFKLGQGPHHHSRLWLSYDGEHQGGYVPLGLQYLLKYQSNLYNLFPAAYPQQLAADVINQIAANLANNYNNSPTARQLTSFMAEYNGSEHPDRINLLQTYQTIPLNTRNGYPEFTRNVGISQGSGLGINISHSFDYIFNTKLFSGFNNQTATSFPSDCGGSYTWFLPHAYKKTKSNWWGSINSSSVLFEGETVLNGLMTVIPRICANIPVFGCKCSYELTVGGVFILSNEIKYKPNSNIPDDVPASTQAAHVELYNSSAYPFYNNSLAGLGNNQTFSKIDPNLHGFVPTVSALDLRDVTTGNPMNHLTNVSSLNLHYISPNYLQNDKRYGFPHLKHSHHYFLTPFDAIYTIGTNNGNYMDNTPKPSNQLHVEDPQIYIGDYISRVEIAPSHLFLTKRNFGLLQSGYKAEFEARKKITVGKYNFNGNDIYDENNIDGFKHYLSQNGDVVVTNNSKLKLQAGDEIELLPGTSVDIGSEMDVHTNVNYCQDNLYRLNVQNKNNKKYLNEQLSDVTVINNHSGKSGLYQNHEFQKHYYIYPNPNENNYLNITSSHENDTILLQLFDMSGNKIIENTLLLSNYNISIQFTELKGGIYILKINGHPYKLIINK